MDMARAKSYEPAVVRELGTELANVKTPGDAVTFVQQYGLLESSCDERATFPSDDWTSARREPVSKFLDTASELRKIVDLWRDVRRAHAGDNEAYERIREWRPSSTLSKRDRLIEASDWCAWGLNDGLIASPKGNLETHPYVVDRAQQGDNVEPGLLRIGLLPETLRQACFLHLAIYLSEKDRIDVCQGCKKVFSRDGRRPDAVFCTSRCAGRERQRRKREKDQTRTRKAPREAGPK